jgi:hypothetical protein
MSQYDFPASHLHSVSQALEWLRADPALADVHRKIARLHALAPAGLRVIWARKPKPQDKAILEDMWRVLRSKGKIEHVQDGEHVEAEADYNG